MTRSTGAGDTGAGERRRHFRLSTEVDGLERSILLCEGETSIGSLSSNTVRLDIDGVSRHHALLVTSHDTVMVQDLESKNGTFVNGQRIETAPIVAGDELRLGPITLRLEEVDAADAELAVAITPAPHSTPSPVNEEWRQQHSSQATGGLLDLEQPGWVHWPELFDRLARHLDCTTASGPSQALAAVVRSLGAAGGRCIVWDGQEEPAIAVSAGPAVPVLDDDELRRLFQEASGNTPGSVILSHLPGDPPRSVVVLTRAAPPPFGLVLLGDASAMAGAGAEAALHAIVRMLSCTVQRRTRSCLQGHQDGETLHGCLVFPPGFVTGESPAMAAVYRQMRPLSQGDIPVLIVGETGTGKEHIAAALHASSRRCDGPFVAINCAAIPSDLLEAELFGIAQGVATGVAAREGMFQQAQGGTLFLDEIAEMPLGLQSKLLRALQERLVYPVGSRRPLKVDVALVSATNSDPDELLASNRIRPDLYYRVTGSVLRLPPLRRRREDIPLLVEHFIRSVAAEVGKSVRGVTVRAMEALVRYPWPGNVRELEHEVRRLVYLCAANQAIDFAMLPPGITGQTGSSTGEPPRDSFSLERHLAALEHDLISRALAHTAGNHSLAAKLLGISRNGLTIKMKRLGIPKPGPGSADPSQ